jgi:anti-sigma B factor antagonist
MSIPSAKLLVFVSGRMACVRIVGRANFTSSIDFKTLLGELHNRGFSCLLLDLADCVLMDSTFLGVLAGFGLKLGAPGNGDANGNGPGIELLNPNPRIAELLENLGVLHLFRVVTGPLMLPAEAQSLTPAPQPHTHEDVTRNCLEAHRTLMEISPANIPKFKEVAQFLAEDLKRLRTAP